MDFFRQITKGQREMVYERRRKRARRAARDNGEEVEDSTESSGTGEEWVARFDRRKEREVQRVKKMTEAFETQNLWQSLKDVMESNTDSDSEFDLEVYERMLEMKRKENYKWTQEREDDMTLEELKGLKEKRQEKGGKEVEVEEGMFLLEAVVLLEDVMDVGGRQAKGKGVVVMDDLEEVRLEKGKGVVVMDNLEEEVRQKKGKGVDELEEGRRMGRLWSLQMTDKMNEEEMVQEDEEDEEDEMTLHDLKKKGKKEKRHKKKRKEEEQKRPKKKKSKNEGDEEDEEDDVNEKKEKRQEKKRKQKRTKKKAKKMKKEDATESETESEIEEAPKVIKLNKNYFSTNFPIAFI